MPSSDRAYQSVWARPARKERTGLSRDQIVTEAIRLLDAEGIDALSMRKLAAALGVGTTSLYWHVTNRDELLELVIDQVHGELHLPEPAGAADWRSAVRRFAESIRTVTLRHPWLVSVFEHLVAAHMGPNLVRVGEHMTRLLRDAGFPPDETEQAVNTVTSYVTGVALAEAAWHSLLARRGQSPQDWMEESMTAAEESMSRHSVLAEAVRTYAGKDPQLALEEDFAYGLDRVLDGLEARLAAL